MTHKSNPADGLVPARATEAQILAFLKENPAFLGNHPELIARQETPSRFEGDRVVDLQHFMVERLKQELEQMRGCAEHLISTSKSNMATQNHMHEAALAALAAGSMSNLARVTSFEFPVLLDVDVVALGFETGADCAESAISNMRNLPSGLVESLLGDGDVMLRSAAEANPILFDDKAGAIKSFALVRLDTNIAPPGVLAIGSYNERAFNASQGTELLAFLGEIVKDCTKRWWIETH